VSYPFFLNSEDFYDSFRGLRKIFDVIKISVHNSRETRIINETTIDDFFNPPCVELVMDIMLELGDDFLLRTALRFASPFLEEKIDPEEVEESKNYAKPRILLGIDAGLEGKYILDAYYVLDINPEEEISREQQRRIDRYNERVVPILKNWIGKRGRKIRREMRRHLSRPGPDGNPLYEKEIGRIVSDYAFRGSRKAKRKARKGSRKGSR